ncbi:MAG: CPBP family intramembrane metalloprotease [Tannerella sp.]|jgi:membrane protease YdiL (CAAX protease family)|nr:CPBP family intramembrane metalloprotease [Tannerella sp.]
MQRKDKSDGLKCTLSVLVAAACWFVMFSPWTGGRLNFWYAMSGAAVILCAVSAWMGDDFRKQFRWSVKDVALGLLSAAVLWGVFLAGDIFSSLLFDFARPQVNLIYRMKEGESPLLLALLLLLLIGPAEEIFWRGYVQRVLIRKYGEWTALIATTFIYALVHLWSFNFMLVMAAAVCGAYWGLLYRYNKNLVMLIVSHAVWDVAVFILFPL